MTKNALCTKNYLFSPQLCDALLNEKLPNNKNKYLDKYHEGIYLVFIKTLHKGTKKLVYNFIQYNSLFSDPFTHFISHRWRYNDLFIREFGEYFVIGYSDDPYHLENKLCIVEELSFQVNNSILSGNHEEFFMLFKRLIYRTDYDHISLLIDLAFKKCYPKYLKEILSNRIVSKPFVDSINIQDLNINSLDQNLYIVYNLKLFLSSIKKRGYVINQGPQKLRGQISGLSYKLYCLDLDFRKSLYNHNQYHCLMSGYPNISRDKFSYNNIHMNLGEVRW